MADILSAEAPGVRITATARGAHLMTWTTDGVERLWLSPLSGPDAPEAIRGGVPVLFPQFGTFGALTKHGFARTAGWTQVEPTPQEGRARLAFELADTAETRAVWPHPFHARIAVSASATELDVTLTVRNLGSDVALFTGGLHNYFRVSDPQAWIEGLDGTHAWDGESTEEPQFTERLGGRVAALDGQDLVIRGAVAPIVLHDRSLGGLAVSADGFDHRVVWNPGPGAQLPDVAPGGEAEFVCIEAASVTPIHLAGDSTWMGHERITLRPDADAAP